MLVELLECTGCGKIGLAVKAERVTEHKCKEATWKVIHTLNVDESRVLKAMGFNGTGDRRKG